MQRHGREAAPPRLLGVWKAVHRHTTLNTHTTTGTKQVLRNGGPGYQCVCVSVATCEPGVRRRAAKPSTPSRRWRQVLTHSATAAGRTGGRRAKGGTKHPAVGVKQSNHAHTHTATTVFSPPPWPLPGTAPPFHTYFPPLTPGGGAEPAAARTHGRRTHTVARRRLRPGAAPAPPCAPCRTAAAA